QLRFNDAAPSSCSMKPVGLVPFPQTPRASADPVGGAPELNVNVQLFDVPPRSMMRTVGGIEVDVPSGAVPLFKRSMRGMHSVMLPVPSVCSPSSVSEITPIGAIGSGQSLFAPDLR